MLWPWVFLCSSSKGKHMFYVSCDQRQYPPFMIFRTYKQVPKVSTSLRLAVTKFSCLLRVIYLKFRFLSTLHAIGIPKVKSKFNVWKHQRLNTVIVDRKNTQCICAFDHVNILACKSTSRVSINHCLVESRDNYFYFVNMQRCWSLLGERQGDSITIQCFGNPGNRHGQEIASSEKFIVSFSRNLKPMMENYQQMPNNSTVSNDRAFWKLWLRNIHWTLLL